MQLIDSIEEVKKHNSAISENMDLENLQSYIDDGIEKHIIPVVGYNQFKALITAKAENPTDVQQRVITLLQKSAVGFMVYYWADQGAVEFSNVGIHVAKSDKMLPASDKKILALKKQNKSSGFSNLENAITFLEDHLSDFPIYQSSSEHQQNRALLINTAAEFERAGVLIGGDARIYQALRVYQEDMESTYIEPLLGADLFEALRSGVLNHNLSDDHKALLIKVQKAVAYHTISEAIPYLAITIDSGGVFQLSETVGGISGNVENRSAASQSSLANAMYGYLSKAESQIAKIRKYITANSDLYDYSPAPVVDINDFPDNNTYFL